jgi:hypothetical protein
MDHLTRPNNHVHVYMKTAITPHSDTSASYYLPLKADPSDVMSPWWLAGDSEGKGYFYTVHRRGTTNI